MKLQECTGTDNPMQRRVDHALGMVPDRHQPSFAPAGDAAIAALEHLSAGLPQPVLT